MDKALSRKMSVLSLMAMLTVVAIHCHTLQDGAAPFYRFVQTFFLRSLSDWAVPYFFIISGFFFGRSFSEVSIGDFVLNHYLSFVNKKSRTLLVPYLIWAAFGGLVILPLIFVNNHVGGHPLFERTFLAPESICGKIDVLFGVTGFGPRGNLALWYVRGLLIFFLLSPVWVLLKTIHRYLPLVLGVVLILVGGDHKVFGLAMKYTTFGWLLVGTGCATARLPRVDIGAVGLYVCAVVYVGISIVKAIYGLEYLEVLIPMFGIAFWWKLYDYVPQLLPNELPWLARQTFFVYCLHALPCGYIMAGGYFCFGKGDLTSLAIAAGSWLGGLAVTMGLAKILHAKLPKIYMVLTGGR